MNKPILLFIFFLFMLGSYAQSPSFQWACKTSARVESEATAVTKDPFGNILVAGTFSGSIVFGGTTYASKGGKDIFVLKFNSSGTLVWVYCIGGPGDDIPRAICTYATVTYVTGSYENSVDFNASSSATAIRTSAGLSDAFVLRIEPPGTFGFAVSMGSTGTDVGESIVKNNVNQLVIAGDFEGSADFNPGAGSTILVAMGQHDVFVQKLSTSAVFISAFRLGGSLEDHCSEVHTDAANNTYVTGSFEGTVDMDPGAGTSTAVSNGSSDVFINKLNVAGTHIWARTYGAVNTDKGESVQTDTSGNVYLAGSFMGNPDFDAGAGSYNLVSNGGSDIFFEKLDSLGNFMNAYSEGGTGNDEAKCLRFDGAGNIFCVGNFNDTADFDPGAGVLNTFADGSSIFVQKMDPSFNPVWTNAIACEPISGSCSMIIDSPGFIYSATSYKDAVDLDPGASSYIVYSPEARSYVRHKLNNAGSFISANAGTSFDLGSRSCGMDILTDKNGFIYSCGIFENNVDFEPGPGVAMASAPRIGIFIQKTDAAGTLQWLKCLTGDEYPLETRAYSIDRDSLGNIYIGGTYGDLLDFDPGAGVYSLPVPPVGITWGFVLKLDSLGNFIWVRGLQADRILEVAVDDLGNIYSTGDFIGTCDFDPGTGTYNLTSTNEDAFICKLDAFGNFIWAKGLGGTSFDCGNNIAVKGNGNIVCSGEFNNATDIDPGPGIFVPGSASGIFIMELNPSGTTVFIKVIEETSSLLAIDMVLDRLENVVLMGALQNTVDMDPGSGTYNVTGGFSTPSMFITKLDPVGNFVNAVVYPPDVWGNSMTSDVYNNIYIHGRFSDTKDFDPGAAVYNMISPPFTSGYDRFITKLSSDMDFRWAQQYGWYAVKGASFPFTGICIDDFGNIVTTAGLDSVADFDGGTGSYILSCTSFEDAYFHKMGQCYTSTTVAATACTDYTYNGTTYTASGNYGQVISPGTVCDSVVMIELTIVNPALGITQTGNTLMADAGGMTYQWIDCGSGSAISGATSQSYSVTADGSYAVEITSPEGCVDTSACVPVVFTGIPLSGQPSASVYPNPFEGSFTLEYNSPSNESVNIEIMNPMGQIVYQAEISANTKHNVPMEELNNGIYFVKMYNDMTFMQKQIVKQ